MSRRELNDWLTGYLKYTDNTEPPKSYHTWTGLSIIAAALQRKAYVKWGFDTIYPNMYVVLVGASGKCRKGTAMELGRDLLEQLAIPLSAESITREQLIRKMSEGATNFTDASTNVMKFHCSLTVFNEELSVFLGQNDIKFLADLTNWYDSRDKWKYETKNAGSDEITGVCLNMLGATAPEWLQSILPQEAVGGGFTSRVIFIVEERKAKTVAKSERTPEESALRDRLIHDLNVISQISGEFQFTQDAAEQYVSWYESDEADADNGIRPVEDPRFSGYCERRATHLRKLCIILSASRTTTRTIETSDIDRALNILKAAELKMSRTFGGLGRGRYSESIEMVLDYMITREVAKRSDILRMFYRDIDGQTMKIIEEVLEGMKMISIQINPMDAMDKVYRYIGPKR